MAYNIDLDGRVRLGDGGLQRPGCAVRARCWRVPGAAVVLASRRLERLKELRAQIEGEGGDAHVVELDVTDIHSIRAAVAHAETEVGSIDILINNSGVSTTQRLQDVEEEDYDFMFDTNTKGAFFVAQEVGKRMLARSRGAAPGSFTGGRIVNVASMAGIKAMPQIGVYSMTKAAVVHMTRAMALEWGRFGINVNALCPGLHRHRAEPPPLADRARAQAGADAAAQARGQARGPGRVDRAAGQRPEPLRQRRRDRGGRRLRGMKIAIPERKKLVYETAHSHALGRHGRVEPPQQRELLPLPSRPRAWTGSPRWIAPPTARVKVR